MLPTLLKRPTDATTNRIEELANDGSWHKGTLEITNALGATDIAAVAYYAQDNTHIRLYYQDRGLMLRERGWRSNAGWFTGESITPEQSCLVSLILTEQFKGSFSPGQAAAHTPLAALGFGSVQLRVFYRNLKGQVVFNKYPGNWSAPIVITSIGPGYKFGVLQWDNGNRLRLYYQEFSGALSEHCSDDGGHTWFLGKFHIASE